MSNAELTKAIKEKALELGYVKCGVTTLDPFPEYDEELSSRKGYERFAGGGLNGQVTLPEGAEDAKCVISCIDSFAEWEFPSELTPYIARAYQSKLYGGVAPGLNAQKHVEFLEYLHEQGIRTFNAPNFMQMPDRAIAARAGLISYGRNNFAYSGKHGSLIIITNIVVDADLETEVHPPKSHCPADCRRCIDACPTKALDDQGRLIPTRCVLYNNMFPGAMLDKSVRDQLGVRIHGCDECQNACPRNKEAIFGANKQPQPLLEELAETFSLKAVLQGTEEQFADTLGRIISPYFKEFDRHRRNAAIAMGNSGNVAFIPALEQAAANDENEEVREAAQWAAEKLKAAL